MNPLEIALIIIGIIIIAISCILVDKSQKAGNLPSQKSFSLENSLTDEEKKQLKDKINEMFTEISDEIVVRTDDTLSNLSNEKIMAVNEFSDQILEKIKRNHEEVVFLYNMLNDKEKELKAAVKEIDSSKKIVQDIIESRAINERPQAPKDAKNQSSIKTSTQTLKSDKPVKASLPADTIQDITTLNSLSSNNNSQILALYSQGKSVMEISKLLGLGQGEVKLVIDLFKGKK